MYTQPTKKQTTCFDVFEQCVLAVQAGELIESISAKDKEFHFQNWFQKRLENLSIHFEGSGRNTYPDFSLVEYTEGYEVKGLAWPGRERNYDSNSQVPTGYHNGRQIFYVFGRYPADHANVADELRQWDGQHLWFRWIRIRQLLWHGDDVWKSNDLHPLFNRAI